MYYASMMIRQPTKTCHLIRAESEGQMNKVEARQRANESGGPMGSLQTGE